MVYSHPTQNFGSTSPLFSRYTSWLGECVSREQQGGDAETLSRIGVDQGITHLRIHGLSKIRGQSETDTVVDMQ
jgi:hypothetical protein